MTGDKTDRDDSVYSMAEVNLNRILSYRVVFLLVIFNAAVRSCWSRPVLMNTETLTELPKHKLLEAFLVTYNSQTSDRSPTELYGKNGLVA